MTKVKYVLAAVYASVICLSACGKQEEKPPEKLPESFTVNAVIKDGELEAGAVLTRTPAGWSVSMTSPERLEGVSFEMTDIDCMAGWGDLRYTAAGDMLCSSPLLLTAKALDGCVRRSMTGTVSGQSYELSFKDGSPDTLRIGIVSAELSGLSTTAAENTPDTDTDTSVIRA